MFYELPRYRNKKAVNRKGFGGFRRGDVNAGGVSNTIFNDRIVNSSIVSSVGVQDSFVISAIGVDDDTAVFGGCFIGRLRAS